MEKINSKYRNNRLNSFEINNKKKSMLTHGFKMREKMFKSYTELLRDSYNKNQERLSNLSPRDFFISENFKCYMILPCSIDQLRQDFDLSLNTYAVLIKIFSFNNSEHKTSARSLAEMMNFNKNIVAESIKDLREKGLITEKKFGQFKKYKINLPMKYKSPYTSDKTSGKQMRTFKFNGFLKNNVYQNPVHLINNVYQNPVHLINNVYQNPVHIESQSLKSQIKKSQSTDKATPDFSFKKLSKRWPNKHQLGCVLSYIALYRKDIDNPFGMLLSKNFTESHFGEFYGKWLEKERERQNNEAKANPIDLDGIHNQLAENDYCDVIEIDFSKKYDDLDPVYLDAFAKELKESLERQGIAM